MALLINNDVSSRVLTMEGSLQAIEDAFAQLGQGQATFQPRTDIWSPTASEPGDYYRWGSLLGAIRDPPRLAFRFKSDVLQWHEDDDGVTEDWFNVEPGTFMGFVLLFDTSNGELLALLNDGALTTLRVGATAGIGCKYMAREDASTVGLLGSGRMARAYAAAFANVRDIDLIKVFSPTAANRDRFAAETSERLSIEVRPVDSAEEAMTGVDIAATCTDAMYPVYSADWMEDGQFIVNVRADEMDAATYERADRVFKTWDEPIFDYALGSQEERDRRPMSEEYRRRYQAVDYPTLDDVVVGDVPGRRSDDETVFFHNISAGIQFAAVAHLAYEAAKEHGLGTAIPLEWFQQDVRN